MTFLQPWAVWFLAGIPVIVLLYFLRLKRRTVSVSTHLFWQRVMQESSRRAFFQKLRHLLSLLLQLLIFLLIAAALARPLWTDSEQSAASTVLLVDTRTRMQATEPSGATRFSSAIAAAQGYARQASRDRQFAIATLDADPQVILPFTDDDRALVETLSRLRPTDAGGEISEGIQLARTLLAGRAGARELVVFTDRPMDIPSTPDLPATVRSFGTNRDNLAITRLASRMNPASPETAEVLLEVQNFGSAPATTDVEISLDGRVIDVKPLTLAPGQTRTEFFASLQRVGRNTRGWLTARIKAADALESDNTAFATLAVRPRRPVLLVSKGSPFLEKLLSVDPASRFELLAPESWNESLGAKFRVVIFDQWIPPGFSRESASGNYLFLGRTPFSTEAPPLERPLITEVTADHPATRNVSLQNITIQRAVPQQLPPPAAGWSVATPLRSFENPILITASHADRRIAGLGFTFMESDLPLRVAFPLLVSQLLHWLEGSAEDRNLSVLAGDSWQLGDGESTSTEPLRTPPKTDPAATQTGVFRPLHNGFYRLAQGAENRWLAVNTFRTAESDLRQATPPMAAAPSAPSPIAAIAVHWPPWLWLTIAALGLFIGEWWLYHRRKTE